MILEKKNILEEYKYILLDELKEKGLLNAYMYFLSERKKYHFLTPIEQSFRLVFYGDFLEKNKLTSIDILHWRVITELIIPGRMAVCFIDSDSENKEQVEKIFSKFKNKIQHPYFHFHTIYAAQEEAYIQIITVMKNVLANHLDLILKNTNYGK